jgi:hypothetical protein
LTFDQYTGLYFYSAVFQGNMALLALAGVFAVLRIQLIAESTRTKENEIITFIKDYYAMDSARVPEKLRSHFNDPQNIIAHIRTLLADNDYQPRNRSRLERLPDNETLLTMLRELGSLEQTRSSIITQLKLPFGSTILVILLSLALVPFATQIHASSYPAEACLFGLIVLLQIATLAVNGRFIFKILESRQTSSA